jgi:hypothetical protein
LHYRNKKIRRMEVEKEICEDFFEERSTGGGGGEWHAHSPQGGRLLLTPSPLSSFTRTARRVWNMFPATGRIWPKKTKMEQRDAGSGK